MALLASGSDPTVHEMSIAISKHVIVGTCTWGMKYAA